ncbi:LCP family protein [Janibacter terrae]|uniref:LCP family protein n=1 Tax=Janibacter terrae TaxID=103817 RepID=UPI0031F73D29
MSERPSRPGRSPGDRSPRRRGEDDPMVFDVRRGRRDDETARAIPTGKRSRPRPQGTKGGDVPTSGRPRPRGAASSRPAAASSRRPAEEPRTRVMPAGTPPSRPVREDRETPRRQGPPPGGGGPRRPAPRPAGDGPTGGTRRRRPMRTFLACVLVLVLVWGGAMVWAVNSAWSHVAKVDATPAGERPSGGEGRNVLLVGSDSREGLSAKERNRLGTGQDTGGARTDSILVLHTGGDRSTLLSIPRDSYVEIPGHGMNKINAAFSIGGPKLLGQTIEHNTGLELDGYMEIGFGGFAQVVDAVGGVNICVKNDMDDPKAHINLKKGCQDMDGPTALGYVRARYSDPEGDLGRAKRQRQFLGALMGKVATPGNLVQPWRVHSLGKESDGALTVGEDDSMLETARSFWAFRSIAKGEGNSVTVPVSDNNLPTAAGSAVQWDDAKSKQLFEDLRQDRPITVEPDDS